MTRRLAAAVVISLVAAFSIVGAADQTGPRTQASPIRLKVGTFRPAAGEEPPIPPGLRIAGYAEGSRGYYLVQFRGPVTEAWKDDVAGTGAELLDYVPDFAFKVRMNPGQARRIERLAGIAWVGLFHPGYKLGPDLRRNGRQGYTVRIERGADATGVAAAIAATGATVLGRTGNLATIAADSIQLEAVAHILDVAAVENLQIRKKLNEYGAGVIMGANAAHANGNTGGGQVIAVADTGLGNGTAASAHPHIPSSRISAIFNWPGIPDSCFQTIVNDGAVDVDSGHGTHVAGSALGGGGPVGEGKGAAPGANLVFQAVENWVTTSNFCKVFFGIPDGYYLIGIPTDIRGLFQQAFDAGARIHSNSWGSEAAGAYTIDSANADEFVWSHRDITVTFAAGNSGTDADLNGVVDLDSTLSPATAKNVLTVGASENDRQGSVNCDPSLAYTNCSAQGGQNNIFTYGAAFPNDFAAAPLADDPTAGNAHQMAAFSSRGPTDDGRIKPDVVAPGTWVLSAYSDKFQQGYDPSANPQNGLFQYDGWGFPQGQAYKYMGGTSMATPLGAGASAVVRDFYQKPPRNHAASAALVKATLINSAVDLLDENNDGVNDNANPIPNNHEGWGRIDLANATDGTGQFVDNSTGLGTGGSATFQYTVAAGGGPLKVSLAWSDFPSTETALFNLVNDLDLLVTSPGGTIYLGNVFVGGWSVFGGAFDRTNNVENVYLASPASGTWTVEVRGFNVPNGPQPFAIVVDGASVDAAPAASIVAPPEGATVSGAVAIQISATDGEDPAGSLTVEWNVDGGAWQPATYNAGSGLYEASWDTTTAAEGLRALNARAADSVGHVTTDSNAVTVDNVPDPPPNQVPTASIVSPAEGSTVAGAVAVQISASDVEDAAGSLTVEWNVDGGTWQPASYNTVTGYYEASWDTLTVSDGSHTVNARATDSGSATGADSNGVVVDNITSIHVGDLDGTSAFVSTNRWKATVTIGVHENMHGAVSGATVTGTWSGGFSGTSTCTTNGAGQCSVTSGSIRRIYTSMTFTVTSVTHASLPYQSGANHDPDGDSTGSSIVVNRP